MAWNAIAGTIPQYQKANGDLASGYYIAFEAAGTSTSINMATDNTGGTEIATCQLDSSGYPITAGSAPFIPHIDQGYKISLYPTSADAIAKTNEEWSIDELVAISNVQSLATISNQKEAFLGSALTTNTIVTLTTFSYTPGANMVGVYINGGRQDLGKDYTETSNTQITFVDAVEDNDYILIISTDATTNTSTPSSSVTYTHGGAGAVATNQDAINDQLPIVAKPMFNIKADGTNDVLGLQAAIDALSAGEQLYLSNGTYFYTGQLTISTNDITIRGESRDGVVLMNTGTSGSSSILITGNDVELYNFQVNGTNNATDAGETISNCSGIEFQNCTRGVVDGCRVWGGHYGIWLNNTSGAYGTNSDHRILNNQCDHMFSTGIHLTFAEECLIQGNQCIETGTDGIKTAVYSRRNRVVNNYCTGCNRDGIDSFDGFIESIMANNICVGNTLQGFEVKGNFDGASTSPNYPTGTYVTRLSIISNNLAEGNGTEGFLFQNIRNMNITGNSAVANTQNGIKTVQVEGCLFNGNLSTRSVQNGFNISSTTVRCLFVGNSAIDNSYVNGTTQNGTYDGFTINTSSSVQMVGNNSSNSDSGEDKGGQRYGFYFDAANTTQTLLNSSTVYNITGSHGGASGYIPAMAAFSGNVDLATQYPSIAPTYTVATLPTVGNYTGGMIYVSDETGGATLAFSNGTNWLRVQDLATVS